MLHLFGVDLLDRVTLLTHEVETVHKLVLLKALVVDPLCLL